MNTVTIALLGKGGVGKTILTALIGKVFSMTGARVLFVDADPTLGLSTSLGIGLLKTIGEARDEIIMKARLAGSDKEKENISEMIDYLLLEALYESPEFSLISMGSTSSLGCYCPLNTLLRGTIKAIGSAYDVIIIDAEAGIEQVNRQVVETVDYPVIVTDNSMRGVSTARMIHEIIQRVPAMAPVKTGVIFNRITEESEDLVEMVEKSGLICYGSIKPDPEITAIDMKGAPLFSISESAPSLAGVKAMLSQIDITA